MHFVHCAHAPPTRLLCVEHVEENNKPVLYLVFEYLNTDLKRFMDRNGKGPAHPLPKPLIKVLCTAMMLLLAHSNPQRSHRASCTS